MARVFVQHDRHGKILGIVSVRQMADDLPHPFHLVDAEHGVIEVADGVRNIFSLHRHGAAGKLMIGLGRCAASEPDRPHGAGARAERTGGRRRGCSESRQ